MKIINTTATAPYPPLIDWGKPTPPDGWALFPDQFYSTFYPADKLAAGFVDITVENGTVTDCIWNEEAYQAYIASLPDPEPETPSDTDPVTWAAMAAAIREGVNEV